jgi:cleavage and polyadenylation specificity factor subunit 4
LERERATRRAQLREILAKQRELGHFEASQEIGEECFSTDMERCLAGSDDLDVSPTAGGPKEKKDGTKTCRFWLQGGCRKGDACDYKHESTHPRGNEQKCRFFARGRCKSGTRCPFSHEVGDTKSIANSVNGGEGGHPQTLLKKLLHKEMKRDESKLLQLFRFFVNNDFFCGVKGNSEPYWMFPWVDDGKDVVDKRATIAALPPVDDVDVDEEDGLIDTFANPESVPHSTESRADMGFFAAYDSTGSDEEEDE